MNLKKYNELQLELMREAKISSVEWILNYSEKFHDLVQDGINDLDELKVLLYKDSN